VRDNQHAGHRRRGRPRALARTARTMIKGDQSRRMEKLLAERVAFVTATVVRAMSPTSVRPGDSAIVLADGTIEGFVGGVCARASVRLHAARALETGEPVILRLEPGGGEASAEDGIVVDHNPCLSGGTMEIFLEPQLPAARILVVGDTPIARVLAEIARAAGYDVHADEPTEEDSAVVVASHGEDEERVLSAALEAGVGYVALVASDKRGAAVRDSLDVPDVLREQLHTPAGLAIGATTPAEIAIAILAEIVSTRVARPVLLSASPAVTAIDPICGMEVSAVDATIHIEVDGERVYFCCEGCRDRYLEQHAAAH
jgi:xanthine dehydrogenase accessory factor